MKLRNALATAATLGTVGIANAAADTSAITAAAADVAIVGGAVFAVYVGVKVFKWMNRAL